MLLLPGQASPDFSHGSEPLGQTVAAISPVTLFHEWSDGSQEGLRKAVGAGRHCKTQYRTRADVGLYKISIYRLLRSLLFRFESESEHEQAHKLTTLKVVITMCLFVLNSCDFI